MKTTCITLFISVFCLQIAFTQNVPQGMNYQAVARDLEGNVLADREITLLIELGDFLENDRAIYAESHRVKTNRLGLFSLTIGHGDALQGTFSKIPWSKKKIWMQVAIQNGQEGGFAVLSKSQMLSVPYAFHAGSADGLASSGNSRNGQGPPTPSNVWGVNGNLNVDDQSQYVGTADDADLVLKTMAEVRAVFYADGTIEFFGDFTLNGDQLVNGKVTITDSLKVGSDIIGGGGIDIAGEGEFGSLNVVDDVTVGQNVVLNKDGGNTTINGMTAIHDKLELTTESSSYIATFENTHDGNGDGLKIKLGKTHPRWNGSEVSLQPPGLDFISDAVGATETLITSLLNNGGSFGVDDFLPFGEELLEIAEDHILPGFEFVGAAACNLTQEVIDELNDKLSLPVEIPELKTPSKFFWNEIVIFPDGPDDNDDPDLAVPGLTIPPLLVTPKFELIPEIPDLPCPPVPDFQGSFDLPNIQFVNVQNSLTSQNKFIQFTDKDDRQLGAIEAQSIEEWGLSYLNASYFLNLFNSFAGLTVIGLDPTQIAETAGKYLINAVAQISNVIEDYNSIGVQYNSGFGDYAEWLERADHAEHVSAGDIIGVVGGKISKDLSNAEQVMAVSTNPIVLGNTPPEDKTHDGNKVAFMGQIPVKVMGPVQTGDFIVGKGGIPGYGVAVHPKDMTVDDFALAVGRAWEKAEGEGPKMVNTVIGVHNGTFINILKQYETKMQATDARLSSIEEQLNALFPVTKSE